MKNSVVVCVLLASWIAIFAAVVALFVLADVVRFHHQDWDTPGFIELAAVMVGLSASVVTSIRAYYAWDNSTASHCANCGSIVSHP